MNRTRRISLAISTASLAVAAALTPGGAGAQGTVPNCTPANNIQAIIDDSGSMASNDSNELRRIGLEIFVRTGGPNDGRRFGAVEFGSSANTVFAPQVINRASRRVMVGALRALIDANNGGTDYDSGFIKAFQDNPGANARIFLTDGANNGDYANTHRGWGGRVYVVGLGIGAPSASDPDANRLQQIAAETNGVYFPNVTAATLQPTFNAISASISCANAPRTFVSKLFTRAGQTSGRTTSVVGSTKKLDMVLNWAQPTNRFGFSVVQALGRKNKVLADLKGKGARKKLRVSKSTGETFQALTVRKPKGTRKFRYRIKAKRVVTGERTVTQVTQRVR